MDIQYRVPALAIAVTALLGMSGCTGQAESYSDLTQAADGEKSVPDAIPDSARGNFDAESIRWIGEHEGSELWLGTAADSRGVCLLLYPDPERWVVGCTDGAVLSLNRGGAWDYHVRPDDHAPPSEAVQVSSNVYVTKR
ncbi:hypothetical protein [Nesterenkonia lutea]|uniref:Lipoprotein n=1 Tax=Nesterenkonia lutea TaxID=272919 RepID=A0ABR9JCU4_9MICC|nr:hypothetical protein [Nesterenkonia lutea]MBE1523603.1 hypothetical protein [Nesterenkonia lutea]